MKLTSSASKRPSASFTGQVTNIGRKQAGYYQENQMSILSTCTVNEASLHCLGGGGGLQPFKCKHHEE